MALGQLIVLILTLQTGCATVAPTRPDQVTVFARHLSDTCQPDDLTDVIAINIKNGGETPIGFPIESDTSKTLGLYPSTFALLNRPRGAPKFGYWNVVTDEFDLPTRLAFVGPGESADFSIPMRSWTVDDKPSEFEIRVWDTALHPYDSLPFKLCLGQ